MKRRCALFAALVVLSVWIAGCSSAPTPEQIAIKDAFIRQLVGFCLQIDIADDRSVKVDMTLTTPNCPSAQELPQMVENAVSSVAGIGRSTSPWSGTRPGTRAG